MDNNLKYVVLGRSDGFVDVLDPKVQSFIKSFKCHASGLSSLAVKDSHVLTTGYSLRREQYVPDPFACSIDLKHLASVPPVSFPAGALQVFIHPLLPSVSLIVSNLGQINFIDIYNPGKLQLYQADISTYLALSDLSSSGDCFAFVDALQNLYLWGSFKDANKPPSFTVYSTPLKFPTLDSEVVPPKNRITFDPSTPLNSVKLPHYSSPLLSVWPVDMVFKTGNPPLQIDPEIIRSSKSLEGFLIARYNKEKYGPRNLYRKIAMKRRLNINKI
ncbi:unnamed protein product [Ambrosiozyma monospora]|uniref:Unnamed protein product n=1 Tax=Ambrosiozyma monospora TaxID=43982 RepID=A0ACB5U768_AMBMO|nr:unnamed protein product [Ambrosiozyma monospora]